MGSGSSRTSPLIFICIKGVRKCMTRKIYNSKNINSQTWAWNLAVLASILFLVYLPSKEALSTGNQAGGYLELLLLLPAGIFYTLLVTFLGSSAAIFVGLVVGLGKLSKNSAVRLSVSFYTEILLSLIHI